MNPSFETPGPLTVFGAGLTEHLEDLPTDPVGLCRVAQSLVVTPDVAAGMDLPDARSDERNLRPASRLLEVLLDLDPAPLQDGRPPERRVVGTCRHFALLACAFLRHRGIPARARCGFATYFVPDKYVDHWIVEYRHQDDRRWIRVDPEILGLPIVKTPEDLADGHFLTGGEAWVLCRQGGADPSSFGVVGAPHAWGIGEIRGNAVRDLASLNKLEMLPWDEWGRMEASYQGDTGPDYDALMDEIAATCAADDVAAIRALYLTEDLQVPASLVV